MSLKLHPTKMKCEISVRGNDYPHLTIDGEYIMLGGLTVGADVARLERKINNTITRFFIQKEARSIMGETIKPDLVLPLKRQWFAQIWNGEKTTEYREVKPYWTQRIGAWVHDNMPHFIQFQIGYAKDGPRLLVQTSGVDVGPCPYLGWEGEYYRIRFEVVQPYIVAAGTIFPLEDMPRMKEKKGGAA